MIDDLLHLEIIQPSRATSCSQAHLVRKPSNGWRFTEDFRQSKQSYFERGMANPKHERDD